MTYKEFKREVFSIYNETYCGADVSPIEYGIQRASFEGRKLERLIELAKRTDFSTAKRKVEGWQRQLERVHEIKLRLEQRRNETLVVPHAGKRINDTRWVNNRNVQRVSM